MNFNIDFYSLIFLFTSQQQEHGTSTKTCLLQRIWGYSSTVVADSMHKVGINLISVPEILPPLVVIRNKQEQHASIGLIKKHFFASRQIAFYSKSTTGRCISFNATSFSRAVFSSFSFQILYTLSSSRKRFLSSVNQLQVLLWNFSQTSISYLTSN